MQINSFFVILSILKSTMRDEAVYPDRFEE